ncbi:sodium/potassium/calcium exchanger 2-like [Convolutriloba macropyga]|uniref:sodium/potassium/calcium exchanger 2-like n=1 Tax=Convolutriloba macropyga TaxID=536237 RepID=UPI003F51EE1C
MVTSRYQRVTQLEEYTNCIEESQTNKTDSYNGFSRMRQFRAQKRQFRKTKDYILLKIGFVAIILSVFLLITTVQPQFKTKSSHDELRAKRATESENVAPWEECDWEIENDTRRVFFIIIWLLLIIWVFIGLAIICDDFFVPSLEIISERLNLTEDVAGATFMAAGSSAPELFTSIAGVSFESDVGVGTIVGSAIFNLLIIIALSAALSKEVLHLDWRPLARDSLFYACSIFMFIGFAWDGELLLWECGVLFFSYCVYVAVMFVNQPLMRLLTAIGRCCSKVGPQSVDSEMAKITESNADSESHDNKKAFHHETQLQSVTHSRRASAASTTVMKVSLISKENFKFNGSSSSNLILPIAAPL